MTTERIGFIGLGDMAAHGPPDHRGRYPRAGYDPRTESIEAAGAEAAASAADLLAATDVALLSLPDSKVVEAVLYGEGGAIDAVREGHVVVDLSTASPDSTRRIARDFAERGADYLDAGISGGAAAAEKGTLTLMVGGSTKRSHGCGACSTSSHRRSPTAETPEPGTRSSS